MPIADHPASRGHATPTPRIALVLQGGGALGAYQAGVYQALDEHGLAPHWLVGTSIGAINAAIIAGNPPDRRLDRLREFWDGVCFDDLVDLHRVPDPLRKFNSWCATMTALMRGVPGFFAPRTPPVFGFGMPVPAELASFYDTAMLAETLRRLVDFDYLNAAEGVRLTVNALSVTTGQLASFDNRAMDLDESHIMASGALPPGFPPVRVGGELYWDGGIFSNTPLETVLEDEPRMDTLCFMVDLWSSRGYEPTSLNEVQTREKDVIYASRSKLHIDDYLRLHELRRLVRTMFEQIPPHKRTLAERAALSLVGADTTMQIVRLVYAGRDWQMAAKDINFSRGSIQWRWQQGYKDGTRAVQTAAWRGVVPAETGIVVHELGPPGEIVHGKVQRIG